VDDQRRLEPGFYEGTLRLRGIAVGEPLTLPAQTRPLRGVVA